MARADSSKHKKEERGEEVGINLAFCGLKGLP
jgi:hypothetical protein